MDAGSSTDAGAATDAGSTTDAGATIDAGSISDAGSPLFIGTFCETTTDGGRWCWESPGAGLQPWNSVFSVSDTEAYAVADNGSVMAWLGGSWRSLREGDGRPLYDVWASSSQDIWLVGSAGRVFHGSASGGFLPVSTPVLTDLKTVFGFSATDVWMAGAGGTILHWDGANVVAASSPTLNGINDLWGANPSAVWGVGNAGTLVRYNGVGWGLIAEPAGNAGTFFSAVTGTSPTDVMVAGQRAWRWDGNTFTLLNTLPSGAQVNGLTPGLGGTWAALRDHGVYFWDGLTWVAVNSGVQSRLTAFSGTIAVGYQGELLHREGNVMRRWSPASEAIAAFGGADELSMVAVGESGGLWQHSGTSWAQVDAGLPGGARSVARTTTGLVMVSFADGGSGVLRDGGYVVENSTRSVSQVLATRSRLWAISSSGLSYRDAVGAWQPWSSTALFAPTGACESADRQALWVSGTTSTGFPPTVGFGQVDADGGVSNLSFAANAWERCEGVTATSVVWARKLAAFNTEELARVNGGSVVISQQVTAKMLLGGTTRGPVLADNLFIAGSPPGNDTTTWAPPPDGGLIGNSELVPLSPLQVRALRCYANTCWYGGERGGIVRRTW
jgi:hypothetical protein